MAGNLKKFVNPRFIKTIDLALMKPLLARHEGKYKSFSVDLLDQEEGAAREDLQTLLTGAEESYPEGLRGDLHRIAELGDARGLEIIQTQAKRQGIDLFLLFDIADEDGSLFTEQFLDAGNACFRMNRNDDRGTGCLQHFGRVIGDTFAVGDAHHEDRLVGQLQIIFGRRHHGVSFWFIC
jgi:hypothetical protein